jgi:large subunit ribosomal protein L3
MAKRKGLLGRKIGMEQTFTENGEVVAVTLIQAGPCHVVQIKTAAVDGYNALQLGFDHAKQLNQADRGHLGECPPLRFLHEVRTDDLEQYKLGQVLDVDVFKPGDLVDVIGTSKGKGFAGGMKRHHFHGGPWTHGQSDRQRSPGAISSGTTPGRVYKGLRMAGHMGDRRITTSNLEVVHVDAEKHIIAVKGAVPGATDGYVVLRGAAKTSVSKRKRPLQG